MFRSDVFPFKFEDYHSEDISVIFENVVFTQNFGPFKEGDKHELVEFNLLDGVITSIDSNKDYDEDDENCDEDEEIIKKVKTELSVETN